MNAPRNESVGIARLVGDLGELLTDVVSDTHVGIAGRAFGATGPLGTPARVAHDAISATTYLGVRLGFALASEAVAVGLRVAAPTSEVRHLSETPAGVRFLATLNGLAHERVAARHPDLTLPDGVFADPLTGPPLLLGADDGLADQLGSATPRIAVFVHGLVETERSWLRKDDDESGPSGSWFGSALRDRGWTPLAVRYNTGESVAENGRRLDALLRALVARWPVAPTEIALVGHSMGGLVIRSACHAIDGDGDSDDRQWVPLVRSCVYLGSPHRGAPLASGVERLVGRMAAVPEARGAARVLEVRSRGVRDLELGRILDDTLGEDHADLPLLTTAKHHVVAAHLGSRIDGRLSLVIGDLLVTPASAGGIDAEVLHLERTNHFHLLRDARVEAQLVDWLG